MKRIIVDLHALKTHFELNGNWWMANRVREMIEIELETCCQYCHREIDTSRMDDHAECLSELYRETYGRDAA